MKSLIFPGLLLGTLLTLVNCRNDSQHGPFFGNGMLNGWADQTSVVLWTRLTKNPEMNRSGYKFLIPSAEEVRKLDKQADPVAIYKAQIPEGASLALMEGACPGSPGEVNLVYFPAGQPEQKTETGWTPADTTKNFTIQWKLDGLTPGTTYQVKMYARKNQGSAVTDSISGGFKTPPDEQATREITFCITTCHDYPRRDDSTGGHKIYRSMLQLWPDFFVHTGDVEYYDKPAPFALTEELMRFKWDRLLALPFEREFFSGVTSYFMKDDHDVLRDDAFPGKSYGTVSWERGLEIFDREQFPSNDKRYKTIRWGKDLQIWIMEGRNYRSRNDMPDGPGKSIWGAEQKQWLFTTLRESDATFKIIISPTPILGPDRVNKKDNYSNKVFKTEGDEIRAFFNQFDNVMLCNGDRHWQYVTHPVGTGLWEFGTGPGSDSHAEGWPPDDKRPEHRFLRVKGGFLKGTLTYSEGNPVLSLVHCDVNGQPVHEEKFLNQMVK